MEQTYSCKTSPHDDFSLITYASIREAMRNGEEPEMQSVLEEDVRILIEGGFGIDKEGIVDTIESHLIGCEGCRSYIGRIEGYMSILREAEIDPEDVGVRPKKFN